MRFLMWLGGILNQKRLKYAWITGSALWITWLISISTGPGVFDLAGNIIGTDYIQFYSAGTTIWHGESQKLYDFPYQQKIERSITGAEIPYIHAFITPPFHAFLYAPLSSISYVWSFMIWSFLGLVILYLSFKFLGTEKPFDWFIWSITWFPVFASISFGQNSLLSLGILSSTYFLWKSNKVFLAGLICGLLLYKPQLMIGILIVWVLGLRSNWKAIVGLFLSGGILLSVSVWWMPEAMRDYYVISQTLLPKLLSLPGFPLWHSHTLRSFWILLFPNMIGGADLFAIVVSIISLYFFIKFVRQFNGQKSLLFAGAICFTILVSPHVMIYDWVILLIPAVLLWENWPTFKDQWKPLFALMWIVAIVSGSLSYFFYVNFHRALQMSIPVLIFVLIHAFIKLMHQTAPNRKSVLNS